MSQPFVFVNYDHPEQSKNRDKRQIISSHIGRFYRNRSGPSRRKELLAAKPSIESDEAEESSASNSSLGSSDRGCSVSRSSSRSNRSNRTERFVGREIPYHSKHSGRSPSPLQETLKQRLDLYFKPSRTLEHGEDVEGVDNVERQVLRNSSVTSILGQGRIDPFVRFAVEEDYGQIHLAIDHAIQCYWPSIAPNRRSNCPDPSSTREFLDQMKASPLAYFSYLTAIITNYEWIIGTNSNSKIHERLRLRNAIVLCKYVRETLEDSDGRLPTSELIGAVLVLGCNPLERTPSRKVCNRSRFRSPLAEIQVLKFFGSVAFPKAHWDALVKMVKLVGGINGIESKDVAGCCQLGDLIESSKKSSPTDFDYHTIFGDDVVVGGTEDTIASLSGSTLSTAFADYFPNYPALQKTIQGVAHATTKLKNYMLETHPTGDLAELLGLRNRAQCLTLNLVKPAVPDNNHSTAMTPDQEAVFAVIRLSLLIFNNLVLFPLPPTGGADTRLALGLKAAIENLQQTSAMSGPHAELLLWALVLGGISDYRDTERQWYLEEFQTLLMQDFYEIRRWSQLETYLVSHMWIGEVLNDEAINFWADSRNT